MRTATLSKRPDEVAGMFDDVAEGYDLANAILSMGSEPRWRAAVLAALGPLEHRRVLDLAAGTGASSVPLRAAGADVVAADFSAGMIERGRMLHPELEFTIADAMSLPFPDSSFDAVTISFGLRNVERPDVALREMRRVTRPGGCIVVCEFSRPADPVLRLGYRAYLRVLLPGVARLVSSDPIAYRYLAETILAWPPQLEFAAMLRRAGWAHVEYRNLTAGVVALHRGRAV